MVTMPQGGVRVVSGWGMGTGLGISGESCIADNVKPNGEKDHGFALILNCDGICRAMKQTKKKLRSPMSELLDI
jgi:hypothetical protein